MEPNHISHGGPSNSDIFISYSSQDRSKVLSIVDQISSLGPTLWIDRNKIEGGQLYGPEIVRAIRNCKVFILMSSEFSFKSRNVHKEIMLAWRFNRPYLPLLIEESGPSDYTDEILYWLEGHQWIEVGGVPQHEWLPRVARALYRLGINLSNPPSLENIQDSPIEKERSEKPVHFAKGINGLYELARYSPEELIVVPADSPHSTVKDKIYSDNEKIFIQLNLNNPAHVLLLNISPRNRVHCLVPSLFSPETEFKAGLIKIPSSDTGYTSLQVSGKIGRERLLAIITKDPLGLDFMPGEFDKITRMLSPIDVEDLIQRLGEINPDHCDLISGYFDVLPKKI